jgi:hypothetical protein
VVRMLQRRGLLEQDAPDALRQDEPLLASLTAASIQGTVASGERAGQRIRRRLIDPQKAFRAGFSPRPTRRPAAYPPDRFQRHGTRPAGRRRPCPAAQ